MADVIINFQGKQTGLTDIIDELVAIGQVEQEMADSAKRTNDALAAQQKAFNGVTSGAEDFTNAVDTLSESITGGAFTRVNKEISALIKNLTSSSSNIDALKGSIVNAQKALSGLGQGSQEFIELSAGIEQAQAALASLQNEAKQRAGLESLITTLTNSEAGAKGLRDSILAAQQELSKIAEGSEDFTRLSTSIDSAKKALAEIDALGVNATFEDIYGTLQPLQTRLGEVEDRLYELALAGKTDTEEFAALQAQAIEFRRTIQDVDAAVDGFSQRGVGLNAVVEAATGITAGFAAAQGAAALFGSESEDLNKALLKVNAAMAILQGLQSIQALLQQQSTLYLTANLAIQRIAILQTNLQAAAESRNIVVRYAAIAAQRALNVVMAANPAGVALIAIGALAAVLIVLTSNTDKATEAQKKANEQLQVYIDSNELAAKVIQQTADVQLATLQRNGASSEEIRQAETQALRDQVKLAKADYDRSIANTQAYGTDLKKLNKDQLENYKTALELRRDAGQKYFDLENQLQIKRIQNQQAADDEALKSATAFAQARVAQAREGSATELQAQIAAIKVQQNEQLAAEGITAGERAQIIAENERRIANLRISIQEKSIQDQINLVQAGGLRTRNTYEKLNADISTVLLQAQKQLLRADADERILIEAQTDEKIRQLRAAFFADLTRLGDAPRIHFDLQDKASVATSAQLAQERLAIAQAESQKKIAFIEEEIAARKAAEAAARDFTISTASSLASSLQTIEQNKTSERITQIQTREQAELDAQQKAYDNGLLTQEQLSTAQDNIRKKYDAQTRALQRQQAVRDKQAAIFQAGVSLSQSILKVLSDKAIPVALQPLYIALNTAAALAQIAAIKSAPIPAFAEGTDNAPGGPSLVGEAGAELVFNKGRWYVAAKPSVIDLQKGAKVIPALETAEMFKSYNLNMVPAPAAAVQEFNFDYRKLSRILSKELSKMPLAVNNWDRRGIDQYITTVGNRNSHLQTKYRSSFK